MRYRTATRRRATRGLAFPSCLLLSLPAIWTPFQLTCPAFPRLSLWQTLCGAAPRDRGTIAGQGRAGLGHGVRDPLLAVLHCTPAARARMALGTADATTALLLRSRWRRDGSTAPSSLCPGIAPLSVRPHPCIGKSQARRPLYRGQGRAGAAAWEGPASSGSERQADHRCHHARAALPPRSRHISCRGPQTALPAPAPAPRPLCTR